MTNPEGKVFAHLYNGYRCYCKDIKGYLTCASIEDIQLWEHFKSIVFEGIENARAEATDKTQDS